MLVLGSFLFLYFFEAAEGDSDSGDCSLYFEEDSRYRCSILESSGLTWEDI
jgi:hypothetical protein